MAHLNGTWGFKFDPGISGYEQHWQTKTLFDQKIVVPFAWKARLVALVQGFHAGGLVSPDLYRPRSMEGPACAFHIGACDFFARVFINGSCVGEHTGGYSDFAFDITRLYDGERIP